MRDAYRLDSIFDTRLNALDYTIFSALQNYQPKHSISKTDGAVWNNNLTSGLFSIGKFYYSDDKNDQSLRIFSTRASERLFGLWVCFCP